jgi:hypothetical protein
MELFDNLATMGFTPKVLQVIILLAIIICFLGRYWKPVAIGCGMLFCVIVFAMPTAKSDKVGTVIEDRTLLPKEQKIEEPPVAEVKPQTDEEMFLEDCNLHSGYTKSQCKALWESDKAEIMKSKWKFNRTPQMQKVKYGL